MRYVFSGFRILLRVVGLATILATLAVTAWADGAWRITAVEGTARLDQGNGAWVPATVGAVVSPGGAAEAGANGRVVMKSASDEATMSPNSRMEAPKAEDAARSNIMQKLDTPLFKIEPAPTASPST